jgi:hypothetical protein
MAEGVAVAVTREDLVELFGEENVVKVPSEALAGLGLDPQTSRVLTDVGLPAAAACGLPPEATALLNVVPPAPVDRPRAGTRYVRFGRLLEDAAEACLDPRAGTVVALTTDADGAEIEVFVNSGLILFVETLYLVNQTNSDQADADEQAYARAVDELHDRLAALDPPAMADDSWWAGVVQEMQLGLM